MSVTAVVVDPPPPRTPSSFAKSWKVCLFAFVEACFARLCIARMLLFALSFLAHDGGTPSSAPT